MLGVALRPRLQIHGALLHLPTEQSSRLHRGDLWILIFQPSMLLHLPQLPPRRMPRHQRLPLTIVIYMRLLPHLLHQHQHLMHQPLLLRAIWPGINDIVVVLHVPCAV